MLGVITTVGAIVIGSAVMRPIPSKQDGWKLSEVPTLVSSSTKVMTEELISSVSVATATSAEFAFAADMQPKFEALRSTLHRYKSLTDGWDGDDSVAAKPEHIDALERILDLLPAGVQTPNPMIASDGEVGFYWKSPEFVADLVIENATEFSLFIRSRNAGHNEIYIPTIAINSKAPAEISNAFLSI